MFDADARARKIVVDRVSEWWAIPLTDEQRPNKLIHAKLQEMVAAALKAAYNEGAQEIAIELARWWPEDREQIDGIVRAKKVPT